VDVLKPSDLILKNFDLNTMCNEIILKMHNYDEIATKMVYERNILAKELEKLSKMPKLNIVEVPKEERGLKESEKKEIIPSKTSRSKKKKAN